MKELKPCPFCGNEAEIVLKMRKDKYPPVYNGLFLEIRCKECVHVAQVFYFMSGRYISGENVYDLTGNRFKDFLGMFKDGADFLIKKWNDRTLKPKKYNFLHDDEDHKRHMVKVKNNIEAKETRKLSDIEKEEIKVNKNGRKSIGDILRDE